MQSLLKFITCGSVDDGKSTLIGHILYDSKLLYTDQEKALELDSKVGSREGKIDYSLLLDGLMAEREQGITIDVAYRYFTTEKRSFIVADTPGHEEYTRNMAVGASFADLAVILIDATQGVLVQTRRHARICSLMGIRYFVFAVNKMDLADYSQSRFEEIEVQIRELSGELGLSHVTVIPVSATEGDNVTRKSENLPWYQGEPLLTYLENVDIQESITEQGFYLPVQRVCRPNHTFRGFQGQIEDGTIAAGEEVTIWPSGEKASVKSIYVLDREAERASKGEAVTIQLDREVDVSRGCVLSRGAELFNTSQVTATLLWMDDTVLENGKSFFVKIGTKLVPGNVAEILYSIDVNTGAKQQTGRLQKNEIAACRLSFADEVVVDTFARHKTLGELILIDRITNMTSACGVVTEVSKEQTNSYRGRIDKEMRSSIKGQRAVTAELPLGLHGITEQFVERLEKELINKGRHTYVFWPKPGDPVREIVRHLNEAGIVVLLVKTDEVDTTVFSADRTYYSNWIHTEKLELEDAVRILSDLSSQYADDMTYQGYI
jgi:sulfate adenylyltransferase subunit 1